MLGDRLEDRQSLVPIASGGGGVASLEVGGWGGVYAGEQAQVKADLAGRARGAGQIDHHRVATHAGDLAFLNVVIFEVESVLRGGG